MLETGEHRRGPFPCSDVIQRVFGGTLGPFGDHTRNVRADTTYTWTSTGANISPHPTHDASRCRFLIVIHKLEYVLNAHLVGTQVQAHAWELSLAMLVMEAVFGIPGVIAAPIYYAYLKDELVSRKLV
jgi:hypothetical protein